MGDIWPYNLNLCCHSGPLQIVPVFFLLGTNLQTKNVFEYPYFVYITNNAKTYSIQCARKKATLGKRSVQLINYHNYTAYKISEAAEQR